MKAYVDKDACIGCELCPSICPEIFEMTDDNKAQAKDIEISDDVNGSAQHAKLNCPTDAIDLR